MLASVPICRCFLSTVSGCSDVLASLLLLSGDNDFNPGLRCKGDSVPDSGARQRNGGGVVAGKDYNNNSTVLCENIRSVIRKRVDLLSTIHCYDADSVLLTETCL